MQTRLIKKSEWPQLEAFVSGHGFGRIEQTHHWAELQKVLGGRDEWFAVGTFDEGSLVASALCVRQNMGRGKTWLWCPGGPLLPGDAAEDRWRALLNVIEEEARRAGDVFLRVEPNMHDDEAVDLGGQAAHTSYLPRHSLVLDLGKSPEEILAQMTQKGRYNIRKASKAGVIVTEGGLEDLPAVYEVLVETAARDGFHVHPQHYYSAFLENVPGTHLYVAHSEGEVVGALFATQFGGHAVYYYGASANVHRKKMAPYALQWHAIQSAVEAGCSQYDFLGIAPKDAPKHKLAGVTQFKTRFGGQRVNYLEARTFVFRWGWWGLYRLVKFLK